MAEDPYFQFPLCALAYGESQDIRLNAILDYAVVDAGLKLWRKLTPSEKHDWSSGVWQSGTFPKEFDLKNGLHLAAVHGAEVIGVNYSRMDTAIKRYNELREYVAAYEQLHGPDAKVRIKREWLFKTRDKGGIKYREFSVLCAIYSAIGNKELAQITRDRISRCALGYRNKAIMDAALPKRTDSAKLLTIRQVRNTLTALHQNKFFASSTYARRITYYSIRLTPAELRKAIVDRRTYPGLFQANQAAEDENMTALIKNKLRAAGLKDKAETLVRN